MPRNLAAWLAMVLSLAVCPVLMVAADAPATANSDPAYQQLRTLGLSGEAVAVANLTLQRDAATFHLRSGTLCYVTPVQGKVTGAVFVGDGDLVLNTPLPTERKSLRMLSKEDEFVETFSQAIFRFTDATYEETKKAGSAATGGCDGGLLRSTQDAMRHDPMLKWNLEERLLGDVLSPEPGGFFLAFVHGKKYNSKEIFALDPHGAPPLVMGVSPEEVEFLTYDENKLGVWAAFHLAEEYKKGTASGAQKNGVLHIEHQQLDAAFEKNANLTGKAVTRFVANVNGLRVVPFNLFPSLRVVSVTGEKGEALAFVQEDKKQDADFAVILPAALAVGAAYTVTTTYAGKEAVSNEGGGNYYPIARDNWYPNATGSALGEYTAYDMTFRIPKGMKIAATGTLVSESNESGQNVSVWKSEVPQTVAGFNFGRFKMLEAKLTSPDYLVQSYANEEQPDWVKSLLQEASGGGLPVLGGGSGLGVPVAMGTMSTTGNLKYALAQAQVAVPLYTDYFGPAPYKRVAMTQQTACTYGQSWPGLVWLPICSFFDTTVRHNLGFDSDRGYWKIVAPHEVAHQWWGHTVGFDSYRDQWMSEGFAEMSASLFIQMVEKNPKKFAEFWADERRSLIERNKEGVRAIDVGPLTMGYRLNNSRVGYNVTRDLIYPKGAFVLHMIRMMMWDRTGDQNFKALMQDFVKTYAGKAATTEDFKAVVERHMTPTMDVDGNHRMDWFFDEYVYGTALPAYSMTSSVEKDANGDAVVNFKLTQSEVDNNFRMTVPIYLELADGRTAPVAHAKLVGNTTFEAKMPLKGLKEMPKRALVNFNYDVLAAN